MKPIFRYILVITALICVQGAFAKKKDNKPVLVNNIYYQLNEEDGTAIAVSVRSIKKKMTTYPEHVVFPDTITYKKRKYVLRKILDDVFVYNKDVKRVTIPNTLTSSDYQTYNECWGLEEPVYNDTLYAYMSREYTLYHPDYIIPDGIRKIEDWAFAGVLLHSVVIPNTVTEIGIFAFLNCRELSSVQLPSSIKCINDVAFGGCHDLKNIIIPNSVKSIKQLAFCNCQLEKIVLGSGLEIIDATAFDGNYKTKYFWGGEALLDENGQRQYTIREITIYRETPPEVEGQFNMTSNQEEIILYVPFYSVDKYTNHPEWGKFDVRPIPPVNDIMLTYMRFI